MQANCEATQDPSINEKKLSPEPFGFQFSDIYNARFYSRLATGDELIKKLKFEGKKRRYMRKLYNK
jgi:hypothetical protein